MENSIEVAWKTENRVAIWSSNLTPGHISRWNYNSKRNTHPYVHSSTIHNTQDVETTWISVYRWMGREGVVHIYYAVSLSHKKEGNNTIWSHVDGPRDCHTRWSKSERERLESWYHLYVESKIWYKWTYLWNRITGTETCGYQGLRRGGEGWRGSLGLADSNYYI